LIHTMLFSKSTANSMSSVGVLVAVILFYLFNRPWRP
jgi:hypothetical protein